MQFQVRSKSQQFDALPIWEEIHVATRLFNAQNASVRVDDVDELGIATL